MKKFLLAPVLSALAMFIFGALYWMSPLPYGVLTPVGDNAAAAAALGKIFPSTGTYLVPGPEMKDQELLAKLWAQGPSAEVNFIREGHAMMEPAVFVCGYIHYFVVSLLLAALLNRVKAALPTYGSRVRFCTWVGLVGAVLLCLSDPIWWHHPWGWKLMGALYAVLAFAVAGLVLAKFIKAEPGVEAPV